MINPKAYLFGMVLFALPAASLSAIVINLEPDPPKYVLIKNPYDAGKNYLFWYVRARVNARIIHYFGKQVSADYSLDTSVEIYHDSQLIFTFDEPSSNRLMSIVKQGWSQPVTPSCSTVMLYIRYGTVNLDYPGVLADTGSPTLNEAIKKGGIQSGDVVVIKSEMDGYKHSAGLIYLGKGYFLSCENGADGFYFRHASHIDSERKAFNCRQCIYRVVMQQSGFSYDSGSCHSCNESEAVLRYKAEHEKIDAFNPPSYIN